MVSMELIRKNITLIIGISIPLLMILFVAISIYLPGFFTQPKYSFLYSNGDNIYYNQHQYTVKDGKLIKNELSTAEKPFNYNPRTDNLLYIYDIVKNESKEIPFEKAQTLTIDSRIISPDGFEVVYGSRGGGFFPFYFVPERDYNTHYLKGPNVSKKINLDQSSSYTNFNFIGWII